MKTKFIRILSLVLIASLLLSISAIAAMNASNYIMSSDCHATRSGNTITISFTTTGTGVMTEIGAKYIYLYESSGSTFHRVKTFRCTDSLYEAALIGSNLSIKSGSVSYSGQSGHTYYAVAGCYAKNSSGSDTINTTSNTV